VSRSVSRRWRRRSSREFTDAVATACFSLSFATDAMGAARCCCSVGRERSEAREDIVWTAREREERGDGAVAARSAPSARLRVGERSEGEERGGGWEREREAEGGGDFSWKRARARLGSRLNGPWAVRVS
jgi:hypothetical protein